jgi:hypothetical protein
MRFSPPDDAVELYETAFEDNDLLGRKRVSDRLSRIIERIEDPLVIALDGRWGTGKTFFLRRWVAAHGKQNGGSALTVYFYAFAHDYMSDPLVALVATLSGRLNRREKSKLERIKRAAEKFIKPSVRVALSMATSGGAEIFSGLGDVAVEALGAEAKTSLEEFWKREEGRQAAFAEFRAAIERLTHSAKGEPARPLVFVIDELDRCRPDYALEVLEVIKHFFSVKHVHFILGANLSSLENSVRMRYGADIDATAYLQKFLSLSISLPEHVGDRSRTPAILEYARHVGKLMETPDHILEELVRQLNYVNRNTEIPIRSVGRILSNISILPDAALAPDNYVGWNTIMVTMLIVRVTHPKLFPRLASGSVNDVDLSSIFGFEQKYLSEELKPGVRNPDFDHDLFLLRSYWAYLIEKDSLDPELREPLKNLPFLA